MTLAWLVRALAAGTLLTLAALAAERTSGWLGAARRWTWAAAMAGSLLLPIVALAAPEALPAIRLADRRKVPAGAPASASFPRSAAAIPAEVPVPKPPPLPPVLGLAWLVGSLAMLGCMGASFRRMEGLRNGCVAARVEGARVLVSEHAGPLVLGVLHPELVLPRWVLESPSEERRLIVRHEREHVAGGDPLLLALAALVLALMPWSPVLWVQHRRLRLAIETDCDARVLAAGASRRLYGRVLLRTSRHPFVLSLLTPAWGGRAFFLERRILAMTAKPPARRLLRAIPLSLLAVGVAAAACGVASRPRPAEPPPAPPTKRITAVEVVGGHEMASRDVNDSLRIMIARRERDPSSGYTGITPYYRERPFTVRGGERVARPVESYPVVVGVVAGSPAGRAGIRERDVLLAINGTDARQPPSTRLRPGMEVTYRVLRDGRELQLRLVATAPPSQAWPPTDADFAAVLRQTQLGDSLRR
ncbi:MAG TPA: M56 family metallopeptidase [Longimicrobiaceae bacterium]|nr:M56 family metallopeptidase [Longimicrobiaceae bacterium]